MGMLATRIIANEIYNINKLYHFTDKSFKGTLVNGKMAPDWIGVDAVSYTHLDVYKRQA